MLVNESVRFWNYLVWKCFVYGRRVKRNLSFCKQSDDVFYPIYAISLFLGDPLPGGNRWTCTNEGEEVAPEKTDIANINCFRCICQVRENYHVFIFKTSGNSTWSYFPKSLDEERRKYEGIFILSLTDLLFWDQRRI